MKHNNRTGENYYIFKGNGTEPPFNNTYWNNKEHGIYVDKVSGDVLFSSLDKFDSGTGWPGFTKPVDKDAITLNSDTIIQQITSRGAIVTTEVAKAINFFKAEEYHQDYLDKNPGGYCHINLNKIYQF